MNWMEPVIKAQMIRMIMTVTALPIVAMTAVTTSLLVSVILTMGTKESLLIKDKVRIGQMG